MVALRVGLGNLGEPTARITRGRSQCSRGAYAAIERGFTASRRKDCQPASPAIISIRKTFEAHDGALIVDRSG